MKTLRLAIIFCVFPWFAQAEEQSLQALFQQANAYYADELYYDAAESYQKLVEAGVEAPQVYYNLGNAYYRKGRIGKAILNYERALRLDPRNEDVKHNLELAKLRTQDEITPLEPNFAVALWQSWFKLFQPNVWSVLSMLFIWLGAIFVFAIIFLFRKFSYKLFGSILSVLMFVFSVSAYFSASAHWNYRFETPVAILVETNAYVKSEPNIRSDDLFIIREGTRFFVERSENDFTLIKLEDGKSGWLMNRYFEKI